MTYSLGKAATEAEEQALAAQQAATLKAPTEAEQSTRDALIAEANFSQARLSPTAQAQAVARTAQAQAQAVARTASGMSTGTKVAIGVGAAVVVAGIAYVALRPKASAPTLMVRNRRRKSSRGLLSNPPNVRRRWRPELAEWFSAAPQKDQERSLFQSFVQEVPGKWSRKDIMEAAESVAEWFPDFDVSAMLGEIGIDLASLRNNGPAVPYDDQKHAVAVTKGVLREVFGDTIDHISDEEMDDAVVPASDDRGQWSPRAAAIIYVENGFPGDYTEYGMELWQQVGAELEDAGLYFEPVNSAVFAVYPV